MAYTSRSTISSLGILASFCIGWVARHSALAQLQLETLAQVTLVPVVRFIAVRTSQVALFGTANVSFKRSLQEQSRSVYI